MKRPWSIVALAGIALVAVLVLAGCPTPPGAVASFAKGPISKLGSIWVNGVEYDVSTAAITINGAPGIAAQLKPGMIVDVQGSADQSTNKGVATKVDFGSSLQGPISAISGSVVTVLGQSITLNASTVYDTHVSGPSALAVGDVVEASIAPSTSGFVAQYLDRQVGSTTYEICGVVSGLGTKAFTLTPSGGTALVVNFGSYPLPTGFANGSTAKVELPPADWVAAQNLVINDTTASPPLDIELRTGELEPAEGDFASVDGIVTNLSGQTFVVDGVTVQVSANTVVTAGSRVEAYGTFRNGKLLASIVKTVG